MMDNESAKGRETAKKKATRKANPQEAYPKAPESGVLSDEALASKSGVQGSEILAHGYRKVDLDLDMFDNERNYDRVRPEVKSESDDPQPNVRAYNQSCPAPGYGAKKKILDQDGEDYGASNTQESSHLDD